MSIAQSFAGAFCITLCSRCDQDLLPALRPLDALTRCNRHAEHLGLSMDQLADLSAAVR